MQETNIYHKAENIRDVIRYIRRFKNALLVIYIDDEIINSTLFQRHIQDISLLHDANLKIIIIPGAHKRIDEVLKSYNIDWSMQNGIRITPEEAMPLIKMAAFDVSNIVMSSLAGEHLNSLIGNWVRARSKGVINGIDYGTAGEIDKLQIDAIKKVLDEGFIPIFPSIGWSTIGKPYNISSISLSEQIAERLNADKLFYLLPNGLITTENFKIPENITTTEDHTIPALSLEELQTVLSLNPVIKQADKNNSIKNKIISLLNISQKACSNGVSRVHILNGSQNGTLLSEIFSDFGSGTMIYSNNYGGIRKMNKEDISSVYSLMQPFVKEGNLLPRTKQNLFAQLDDFVVYELDGRIRACAGMHCYPGKQAEIIGVTVDHSCSKQGIGAKLIEHFIKEAQKLKFVSLFILTTQSSDWFEKFNFVPDSISSLPEKRKEIWSSSRNSKVYRLYF